MAVSGGAVARLVVLCSVLAGLFLMHGSPTAAAGCHRPTTAAVHADHSPMAPAMAGQGGQHAAPVGHPGETCVSTQVRGGAPLVPPGPLPAAASPTAPTGCPQQAPGTGDGSRAPPHGGRAVLLKVCVART